MAQALKIADFSTTGKAKGIETQVIERRHPTEAASMALSKLGHKVTAAERVYDKAVHAWLTYAYDEVFGFPCSDGTYHLSGGIGEAEECIEELLWLRDYKMMRSEISKQDIKRFVGRIWHIDFA